MKCTSCGTNNKDGMKFCKHCGTPLRYDSEINNSASSDRSAKENRSVKNSKSSKGSTILIILIIIVLLAIGGCVAILLFNNSSHIADFEGETVSVTETLDMALSTDTTEEATEEDATEAATEPATAEMITVPDVVGLNKDDAEKKINDSNLSIIVRESEDDSVPNGYVVSQSPIAGKSLEKGESVTIYISKKQTPSTTNSSSDGKKYLYCCASDFATLRNRPSRSGSEIVKITTREKVEYLGRDGEFYYVSYNGKKGYVLAEFFSEDINAPLNYGTGNL